jgi:hypothetical protein
MFSDHTYHNHSSAPPPLPSPHAHIQVPRLTESMIGCVEFPGGFFLGVKDDAATDHHHDHDSDSDDTSARGKTGGRGGSGGSGSGGEHSMLARVQLMLRDTDDVILVDLSRNAVTSASPRLPVTFKVCVGGEERDMIIIS